MENINHRNKLIEIFRKYELYQHEILKNCEKIKNEYEEKLQLKNKLKDEMSKNEMELIERKTDLTKTMNECIELQERNTILFENVEKVDNENSKTSFQVENDTKIVKDTINNLNKLAAENDPNEITKQIDKYTKIKKQIYYKMGSIEEDIHALNDAKSKLPLTEYELTDEMKAMFRSK